MKKPLLILLCLIGLSAFNQASAQNDLDIQNATGCDFNVTGGEINPVTCIPSIALTTFVPAGGVLTVAYTGAPNIVNKFYVVDCAGTSGAPLWDYTMCGWGNMLIGILPPSFCCPTVTNITLTPATPTSNALISIF